ncbi:hypothetical protein, partial [Winogradskyella sp.]|uniref:hypothetical protein n=1 Tax=Winogradskyella sp. TaxID=1883156 RepID=UPI0025F99C2D
MKIFTRFSITKITLSLLILFSFAWQNSMSAQCIASYPFNNDDQIWVAGYHCTIARTTNGFFAWGDAMSATGTELVSPTQIAPVNGYNYSGTVLLVTIGDQISSSNPQNFLLTTFGLYVWGNEGQVIANSLTTSSNFQLTTLPVGVLPADVKSLKASNDILGILTNSGDVWIRALNSDELYGDGTTTGTDATWHQSTISNVESMKVSDDAVFVYTTTGDFYTWGQSIRLGNGTGNTSSSLPVLMTSPFPGAIPSMISLTSENSPSYYALHPTNGFIYAMGENQNGRLGIGSTTDQSNWVIVQNAANTGNLENVIFIDAVDNTNGHSSAGAITSNGAVYFWGDNSFNMLSSAAAASQTLPVVPAGFNLGTDFATYLEMSGHYSLVQIQGNATPCFVGHTLEGNLGGGVSDPPDITILDCDEIPDIGFCVSQPTINAEDDDFSGSPFDATGGTTASVFENNGNGIDLADGVAATNANIADNISISDDGGLTGITINTDGTIDVPTNLTSGTYIVEYTICLEEDNTICTTANVTIEIIVCDISAITSSNVDPCNDNSTPTNLTDDTFTSDITITFTDAPTTGTLDLTGDGTASVSAVGLTSPHTFVDVVLPADGGAIDLTATFSADGACTFNNTNVLTAPFECSDDACPDVIPEENPILALVSGDVTFDITGAGGASGAILNSISVAGEPNPFTGFYIPTTINYQFSNSAGANQYIRDMLAVGSNIDDGPAVFDPALLSTFSDRDLTHYLSTDNAIVNTDFVEMQYDSPIASAANRYVVLTERNGNNRLAVQALDASGTLIGTQRLAETSPGLNTYFTTNIPTDFGQDVFVTIFPLTSLVASGLDIHGLRITQFGSTSNPVGSDGGDGKAFILYDPAFLTPPPTIEATTSAVQPTCPSNEGSITIDATDNGGGTIEYSLTSLSGSNDQGWQASNVFNNLPPDTYTPVVRYQSTPTCLAVSNNPIVLVDAGFNILSITSSDVTACNDNGTPTNLTDDTFTADITVTFDASPGAGTLDLTGDGTVSVSAVGLTSPHTFDNVVLPANGSAISLTATFSDEVSCTLANTNVLTAPFECSDDACPDVIPTGNPVLALVSGDVTFDITGAGGTSGAILNSISVAGEPNPFTGFYIPTSVNYQYSNPAAANQYIRDMSVPETNIDDGPAVFDPTLLTTFSDRDLTHYLSGDNAIVNTDFVEIQYDAPMASAANRYVVLTERNGNNRLAVQALDASGTLIGTQRLAETSPGLNTYFTTNIPTDFGQDVFVTIFPLTSLVASGLDIHGLRITQFGSTSNPVGSDGGDGKAFILYDPAFLTPPPTIEATTSAVQPTCPSNEGSITIDATDNGGGTIEYSLTSLSGSNDQGWQASNVFNNLPPDTYTPVVRYQSTPTCLAVSNNPIVLNSIECPSIETVKTVAITNDVAPVGASLGDTMTYTIT